MNRDNKLENTFAELKRKKKRERVKCKVQNGL